MVRVEMAKWGQSLEDLRVASVESPHQRTRERFQALCLIASGGFNATTCAAHIGRHASGRSSNSTRSSIRSGRVKSCCATSA